MLNAVKPLSIIWGLTPICKSQYDQSASNKKKYTWLDYVFWKQVFSVHLIFDQDQTVKTLVTVVLMELIGGVIHHLLILKYNHGTLSLADSFEIPISLLIAFKKKQFDAQIYIPRITLKSWQHTAKKQNKINK